MKERKLFPDWLERRDPFLQRAAENPVFQAFVSHREAQRRRGWRSTVVGLLPILPIPAIILLGILLAPITAGLSLPVAFAGAIVLRVVRTQGVSRKALLPFWVSNVFGTKLEQNILLDLWQTPNGARNYAEALLLEKRLRDWRFGSLCILAVLGTVELTCALVMHPWSIGDILVLIAIPFTLATLIPFVYWIGARNAAAEVRRRMDDLFLVDAIERAGNLALQGVARFLAFVGLVFGIIIATVLVGVLFWKLVIDPMRGLAHFFEVRGTLGQIVGERVRENAVQLITAAIIAVATFAIGFLRPLARKWWVHTREDAFSVAEIAIPFVIAHLTGDPDYQETLMELRRQRGRKQPSRESDLELDNPVYSSPLLNRALQERRLA